MSFREDFLWGAATAAYQIEGAARQDDKGVSVWDAFCDQPDRVWQGQNGGTACDHYNRFRQDVALMRDLKLKAYRFSISWPRVLPEGVGKVNEAGLAFYDRLVDELLAAQITPLATLFHWDYPYELYLNGGWLNKYSPDWFAEYAQIMSERLSDRVRHWITFNEPQCFIGFGHQSGRHAPGDRLDFRKVLRAAHHVLLAHGKAVQAIHGAARQQPLVGLASVGIVKMPASDRPEDLAAAREEMFAVRGRDVFNNTWWMDPVVFGKYPEDGLRLFEKDFPVITYHDLDLIHQPLDFFGVNIYGADTYRRGPDGRPEKLPLENGCPLTAFKWVVTPAALYWGPRFFWERYQLPIIITENGLSNPDWVALDGQVHDPQRIDFTARYLRELKRAATDGVDVRGYCHWSFMDNFEWSEGYKERFGLVYVDYRTQTRIPKDSALWYRRVIETNGAEL